MHYNSKRAKQKKAALLLVLGRRCAACGKGYSATRLTFDVIIPDDANRDTEGKAAHHRVFSWLQRMNFYCRQLSAGNLQVLCDKCNSAKHDDNTRFIAPLIGNRANCPF